MPTIRLYEHAPTRSARCRWTLGEAGLEYESLGNAGEIIGSAAVRTVHPLGKVPAAVIDGRPLFESAAICTAIADLVPERNLIAKPGSWSRALHDQWVSFALTEMECWLWSTELHTYDFQIPKDQQVPQIAEQNSRMFVRSAAVLDAALAEADYLVEDRFTVSRTSSSATPLAGAAQTVCWETSRTCRRTWSACSRGSTARWRGRSRGGAGDGGLERSCGNPAGAGHRPSAILTACAAHAPFAWSP